MELKGNYNLPFSEMSWAVIGEDFQTAFGMSICPTCYRENWYAYHKIKREITKHKVEFTMSKYKLKVKGNKIPVYGGKEFITEANVHMYDTLIDSNEQLKAHFDLVEVKSEETPKKSKK